MHGRLLFFLLNGVRFVIILQQMMQHIVITSRNWIKAVYLRVMISRTVFSVFLWLVLFHCFHFSLSVNDGLLANIWLISGACCFAFPSCWASHDSKCDVTSFGSTAPTSLIFFHWFICKACCLNFEGILKTQIIVKNWRYVLLSIVNI